MADFILGHVFDGNNHCQSGVNDDASCQEQYDKCPNDHTNYITVEQFKEQPCSMPDGEKEKCLNIIKRTLRVIVNRTSKRRPLHFPKTKDEYPFRNSEAIRHGTGFLLSTNLSTFKDDFIPPKQCPCPECKNIEGSPYKKPFYFLAVTATHVVFDDDEVKETVFELYYDEDGEIGRSKVKFLYGISVFSDEFRVKTDKCYLVCVTHDARLSEELMDLCDELVELKAVGFMASHPHGVAKRISNGDIRSTELHRVFGGLSCTLPSGTEVTFPERAPAISSGGKMELMRKTKCGNGKNNAYILQEDQMIYIPLSTGLKYEEKRFLWPDELKESLGGEVKKSTEMCAYSAMCYLSPGSRDRTGDWTDLALDGASEGFMDEVRDDGTLYATYFYTISTCPGSSGALVLAGDLPFVHCKILHFGDNPKGNRSGLCSPLPVY